MKNDDFEKQISGTPMRKIPAAWRTEILGYATQPLPPEAPIASLPAAVSAAGNTPPPPVRPPHIPSWRDLLWPSPLAWAALALVWSGIFVSNISFSSRQTPAVATTGTNALLARLSQERTLAENREAGL